MSKIRILKNFFVTIAISLFVLSCSGTIKDAKNVPSGTYELDKGHTSVHFKVNHLGLSFYTARFTKFDAKLEFDAKKPTNSKVFAKVWSKSITTDYNVTNKKKAKKNFDKFLSINENWLNSNKHPYITFESTKISRTGFKTGVMKGNLTMLGVTKPVKFDVTFNGAFEKKPYVGKAALGFSAKAKIKRSEWGFGAFVPNIGDDVEIIIETEFHKK